MKKMVYVLLAVLLCTMIGMAYADAYELPVVGHGGSGSGIGNGQQGSGYTFPGIQAKMVEKLAWRSGPSTEYTTGSQMDLRGTYVTVYSVYYDINGVPWVEVEINAGGLRRVWTGAKRLDLSDYQLSMLPVDVGSYLGYGKFTSRSLPRSGPGAQYSIQTELVFSVGDQVVVLKEQNGYYLTECRLISGEKFRSWVPVDDMSALSQ